MKAFLACPTIDVTGMRSFSLAPGLLCWAMVVTSRPSQTELCKSCGSSMDSSCLLYSDTSSNRAVQVTSPSQDSRKDVKCIRQQIFRAFSSQFPELIWTRKEVIGELRSFNRWRLALGTAA